MYIHRMYVFNNANTFSTLRIAMFTQILKVSWFHITVQQKMWSMFQSIDPVCVSRNQDFFNKLNAAHYTWITTGPYVLLTWSSNISQIHTLLLLVRWRFTELSRKSVHLIKAWVLWSSVNFWCIKASTISLNIDKNTRNFLYKLQLTRCREPHFKYIFAYFSVWTCMYILFLVNQFKLMLCYL